MRASECDILILPGLNGGSPDHWYARWAAKLSTAQRVEQRDFNAPNLAEWRGCVLRTAQEAKRPVILIGHSLGALTAVHCAQELPNVAAAFLAAPPSAQALDDLPEVDSAFKNIARARLPFPAILAASRNDSYCAYEISEEYAAAWGATLADAGEAGHINPDSGYGPWPEGLLKFAHFLSALPARR